MFGISAPRVAVRAAIPWYLRWLALVALALVILSLSRAAYDFGRKFAGFDQSEADQEVQRLGESNAKMQQELAQLRGARHGAVLVHDLADHARRLQAGQTAQVNGAFRMAGSF